jgi:peptide/nickel transport system substrate-binding protein
LRAVPLRRLVALALLGLAGCRQAERGRGAASDVGGTLVIATPGDADNLLPPIAATQLGAHVAGRLFPKLAELKFDLNTVDDSGYTPVLAQRWEHRDSLTLVFHLDPRARWQDGRPITADDVVFTYAVYTDALTASPYRANLAPVAAVTREDERTVVFRFRRAYPEQLYDATYHLHILPRHLLDTIPRERLAASAFARDPVGAGPFRFVRWDPGADIEVEADTGWFLGRPKLDRIVWRALPDVSAAVTALIAGEADAMETIPQRDEIERVLQARNLRLVPYSSPFLAGILFNLRRPLFASRELRRALAMGLDRQTIVRSVFGPYAQVPTSALSQMVWAARDSIRQVPYDTVEAQRLLDTLGWRRGPGQTWRTKAGRRLAFTLLVPTTSRSRQQAAVLVQDQLKRLGVDVQIQPLDFAVFDRRGRAGDFDAQFFSRTLDPSPAELAQFWSGSAVGQDNQGAYASPAFDSLLAAAAAAPTRDAALVRYRAALERLNDDAPAIFIYSPSNNAAISRRFQNVTIRPDSWLATVATWSVAPDRRLPRDR